MSLFNKQVNMVFLDFVDAMCESFSNDSLSVFRSEMFAIIALHEDLDGPELCDEYGQEFYDHRDALDAHDPSVFFDPTMRMFARMVMGPIWEMIQTDSKDDVESREAVWGYIGSVHGILKMTRAVSGNKNGFQSVAMGVVKGLNEDGVLTPNNMSFTEILTSSVKHLNDTKGIERVKQLFDPSDQDGIMHAMDAMGLDPSEFFDPADLNVADDGGGIGDMGGMMDDMDEGKLNSFIDKIGGTFFKGQGQGMGLMSDELKRAMGSMASQMRSDPSFAANIRSAAGGGALPTGAVLPTVATLPTVEEVLD